VTIVWATKINNYNRTANSWFKLPSIQSLSISAKD